MKRLAKEGPWALCTGVFYSSVFLLWPLTLYGPTLHVCVCVCVCTCMCICQWLRLHCSDERVAAGGLQSTLYHVRAAGSRLTRCPGSWRLCPAACEWWWHKEGPAESAVCSLCLPFSFAHDFRLQKEAVRGSIMASGGWGTVPVPTSSLPLPLLKTAKKKMLLDSFELLSSVVGLL